MITTQNNFHPIRGHIADNVTIKCNNGDILTITATIKGWKVTNQKNEQISPICFDAYKIAASIINY